MTEPQVRYFEDLMIGVEEWGIEEIAVEEDMIEYAVRYDPWPFHVDEEAARETPFGGLIGSSGYSIGLWYSFVIQVEPSESINRYSVSEFSRVSHTPRRIG